MLRGRVAAKKKVCNPHNTYLKLSAQHADQFKVCFVVVAKNIFQGLWHGGFQPPNPNTHPSRPPPPVCRRTPAPLKGRNGMQPRPPIFKLEAPKSSPNGGQADQSRLLQAIKGFSVQLGNMLLPAFTSTCTCTAS